MNTPFRSELLSVLTDVGQYLRQCRDEPVVMDLSEDTKTLMNAWGVQPFACQGPENADVFIVDSKSSFFREDAGKLLVKILGAMKLLPDAVWICNAVDRAQVLKKIRQAAPKVVIALGETAAQRVLDTDQPIERLRGNFQKIHGIPVMPTFHPEFLLAAPDRKKEVWADIQQVMALLEQ